MNLQPDDMQGENPLSGLRSWLSRKSVPEHRHSIWYYFGGLTLFLLLVLIGTGVLLSVYYEPSAAPATAPDGTPLAAARVLREVTWNDRIYTQGDIIALPLNESSGEVIAAGPLRGNVETVLEETSGRPLLPSAAWVSVEGRIMREVEFGSLIRSIHGYAANLLIAAVVIHMFSAFLMRAYRRPRALLWTTGGVLFLLVLGFGFTGYLLPWNRLAFFATRIGADLPEEALPGIGATLATLIRGGDDVTGLTLTRMYSAHAVALPLATLVFVGMHILLLQVFGISTPAGARRSGGTVMASLLGGAALLLLVIAAAAGRFDPASPLVLIPLTVLPVAAAYLLSVMAAPASPASVASSPVASSAASSSPASPSPASSSPGSPSLSAPSLPDSGINSSSSVSFYGNYIYRDFLCWLLAFGVIITLAVLAPWGHRGELAMPVDLTKPLTTPKGIHPEWYFMPPYQLLRLMPGLPAAILMTLAGIFLFAIPYLDRRASLVRTTGIILMAAAITLAAAGYLIPAE